MRQLSATGDAIAVSQRRVLVFWLPLALAWWLMTIESPIILGVPAHLHALVIIGAQVGVLLPLLTTLHSYFRALLMLSHRTSAIYQATVLGFVLTALVVWGGIGLGMKGILAASLGLTLGHLVELVYLYSAYRRGHDALQLHWQSVVAAA